MRFVPIPCVQPGMILSRNVYGSSDELLLVVGHILSENEIERLQALHYPGVYIVDGVDQDISSRRAVSRRLRENMVQSVKGVFEQVGWIDDAAQLSYVLPEIKGLVGEIIETITLNRHAFINMMDLQMFDDYTYEHSVNVATISIVLGAAARLGKSRLYALGMGALLHDIGKIFIKKEILDKPGKLTIEEFEAIKEHSRLGSEYLRDKWAVPDDSSWAVLTHHEKYDGTGYPLGLKGYDQSLYGKIIAVSDVYDALTSDRPYRKALSPSEGMEYVMGSSGSLFDPQIVEIFVTQIQPYPVGTCVQLSNGMKGIVVENHPNCGLRPSVKIISSDGGPDVIDLFHDENLLCVTVTGKLQTDTVFSQECAAQNQQEEEKESPENDKSVGS